MVSLEAIFTQTRKIDSEGYIYIFVHTNSNANTKIIKENDAINLRMTEDIEEVGGRRGRAKGRKGKGESDITICFLKVTNA